MVEVAAQTRSAGQARRAEAADYRPDIDGLRGVAVIMVVLWHAGVSGVPGGFAGVDAFFVISGYVITRSLQRDAAAGGVSIPGFYARRLRRIAPAFLVMLAVVLALAFVIELPAELTRTARVALGALAFSANIVLWRLTGYFGHGAESEPLRHVWSLSIEEQFYLVYPALLALLLARAPKRAGAALAALAALSFGLFLLLWRRAPEAAFELGPARAWALLAGCVCALESRRWRAPRWVDEGLTLVGAALIAAAALGVARDLRAMMIASSLGAALIVLCGSSRPLVSRALAAPPVLLVGLASYSLYLWHWPLLALATSLRPTGIGAAATALLLAATAVLGFASWRFIEQPLRRPWRDAAARRRFFAICGGLCLFSVAASAAALAGNGWPGRFPPRTLVMAAYQDYARSPAWKRQFRVDCFDQRASAADYDAVRCFTAAPGRPNVLLWGDSHAAELAGSLSDVSTRLGAHLMQATMAGCAPTFGPGRRIPGCRRFNDLVRDRLRRQRADVVILAFSVRSRLDGFGDELDDLRRSGARIILVGPTPEYQIDVAAVLARASPAVPNLAPWRSPQPFKADVAFRQMTAVRAGVAYVSAIDLFCPGGRCAVLAATGAPLVFDKNHLTPDAAQALTAQVAVPLADALRARPAGGADSTARTPRPAPRS